MDEGHGETCPRGRPGISAAALTTSGGLEKPALARTMKKLADRDARGELGHALGPARRKGPLESGIVTAEIRQGEGDLVLAHAAIVRRGGAGAGVVEHVARIEVEVDADGIIAPVGGGNAADKPNGRAEASLGLGGGEH